MNYFNPVQLVFGSLVRGKISEECIGKSVLIICSSTAYDRYSKDPELSNLFSFASVTFEHGFESNPSLTDIIEITNKYRDSSLDLIIGLGGGSAMDVAKIASVSIPAIKEGIHIDDLLENSTLFLCFKEIDCIQVPTTAGTGSEVTPFATVWDYGSQQKKSLSHPVMYAKKAFIDPDFLSQVPLSVAISTGLDALNQAFESIWNVNANEFTRPLSRRAVVLALQGLTAMDKIPNDPDLRHKLSLASLFAGLAISQTRTSICHSISYPLTLKYGIEHGMACSFSILEVFKYNSEFIKDDLELIQLELKLDPYKVLETIIRQHEVSAYLEKSLPNKAIFFESIEDFIAAGRFENNIKTCNRNDLIQIITTSYNSVVSSINI
ncbi:phosphonoacetaldehyde reductase [Gammaproteobacteria bacterium]|jgi:alcohol dehydrogenase class IV|nr:phosphonoacetaldehyde reductase [Gammaproteobacteria bacterium]